ncbi:MAG: hypothetical protein U0736_25640 [Gemmataceae bacterium]
MNRHDLSTRRMSWVAALPDRCRQCRTARLVRVPVSGASAEERFAAALGMAAGRPAAGCGGVAALPGEPAEHEAEEWRLGEQRYRSLVEATTAIVWNTPASGEFEAEQPGWSAFTAPDVRPAQGWGWLDAVHPDDLPQHRPRVVRCRRQPVALPGRAPAALPTALPPHAVRAVPI